MLKSESKFRVIVNVTGSQSSSPSQCVVCGSCLDRENRSEILNVCRDCWRGLVD